MKNKLLVIVLLVELLFAAGCTNTNISNSQPDHTDKNAIPSVLPTKRSTITSPTSTVTPTTIPALTPTTTSDTKTIRNCLSIASGLPGSNNPGTVVLLEPSKSGGIYFLLDLATMNKTVINSNFLTVSVSPDGKHYAYKDYKEHLLKIYSADNQLLASYDWKENWSYLSKWQNNQSVIIYKTNEIQVTPSLAVPMRNDYPRTLILFDPFSNQEQILAPDYPGIDRANPALGWDDSGTTVYNYQLTQVVYPSITSGLGVTLWDIPSGTVIIEEINPYRHGYPKWAQDGSKFIISWLEDELYIVTSQGELSQITNFNQGGYQYRPEYYSWSPDGRYIAFWLDDKEASFGNFMILDTHSQEITDYCISLGYNSFGFLETPLPIWAQNGKAVVIEARLDGEENGKTALLLLDLENNLAIRLADNAVPVGWLESED